MTVLRGLAYEQARTGHRVVVVTIHQDSMPLATVSKDHDKFCAAGVEIKSFKAYWSPVLFSPGLGTWLRQTISSFDIVHIHGLYRFPVTYAAWLARKTGIPYIIRPLGSLDPFLYRQSRFGKMALPLKRIYERLFDIPNLNHASAIHYTAKEEMERTAFLKLCAPAVIIPNGIDWQQYAVLPQRGGFRGRIGLEEQTPLVLFLGRINFVKGLDLVVPGFAYVIEKFPDARLAIVGPDNEGYGSKVRQWCHDYGVMEKVYFVDHLGPEEVKQAYVDADVFVLSSYTENFGMTVAETMACGCPVVISDQVNIWREVQEEGAGLVVGLDPPKIANTICRVLSDKEAAGEMGKRCRMAAEKRYSWPRIVDQMTQMYREVIEEAAAKRRVGN